MIIIIGKVVEGHIKNFPGGKEEDHRLLRKDRRFRPRFEPVMEIEVHKHCPLLDFAHSALSS
jgi:hypothetical protein